MCKWCKYIRQKHREFNLYKSKHAPLLSYKILWYSQPPNRYSTHKLSWNLSMLVTARGRERREPSTAFNWNRKILIINFSGGEVVVSRSKAIFYRSGEAPTRSDAIAPPFGVNTMALPADLPTMTCRCHRPTISLRVDLQCVPNVLHSMGDFPPPFASHGCKFVFSNQSSFRSTKTN